MRIYSEPCSKAASKERDNIKSFLEQIQLRDFESGFFSLNNVVTTYMKTLKEQDRIPWFNLYEPDPFNSYYGGARLIVRWIEHSQNFLPVFHKLILTREGSVVDSLSENYDKDKKDEQKGILF